MRILAVANQKGGQAKSTVIVHLAYAALEAGLRVLVVDMDPQASVSLTFESVDGAAPGLTASSLFGAEAPELAPEKLSDRLSIIRADELLMQINGANEDAKRRPAKNLRTFAKDFDLCLIDTPGAIGFNPPMTIAALIAADAVVCPFAVGLYEGKGLADLWAYLRSIKAKGLNPSLRLLGLMPCKVNTKSREEMAALAQLRTDMGNVILPWTLAERTAVKQAIMRRRPVWKNTKGAGHLAAAKEWRAACTGVLGKLGGVSK